MNYISFTFLFFSTIVILLYFIIPKKRRWLVLLAANIVFYAFADISSLAYVTVTTVTTFFGAKLISRLGRKSETNKDNISNSDNDPEGVLPAKRLRLRHIVFLCTLLLNFGVLFVLKYSGFFAENMLALLGLPQDAWHLRLILPLGISFYTFQSMGYLIDVYRSAYEPADNLPKFAVFVTFFPQIVQGPIGRYNDLAHQLYEGHDFNYDN